MTALSLQADLETAVEEYKGVQLDMQKTQVAQRQLFQQQHENEMVLKELELLDEESKVYKLIGPVFVRQDHVEATSNVKKRLEYIGSETKRLDEKMSLMEEKLGKKQARIVQLQNEASKLTRT